MKKYVTMYVGYFKDAHHCKFDKRLVFATVSENWIHTLRLSLNSSCCLKKPLSRNIQLQKCFAIIFQFQLVRFVFTLILEDPLISSLL